MWYIGITDVWPVMEDIGFYRSVWGRCVVSCAMGGLLEEMEEGRLLVCVGKIYYYGRLYESGQWEEHFTGNVGEILLWTSCFWSVRGTCGRCGTLGVCVASGHGGGEALSECVETSVS